MTVTTTATATISQLRLTLRRPAFLGLIAANIILGGAGGGAATGFDGLSPGAGIVGGACRGWTIAFTAWPPLAALSCAALLCERSSRRVGEALLTCGVPLRTQARDHVLLATLASLIATLAALPAGALVGLGDAIRQGGDYEGGVAEGWPSAPGVVLILVYLVVLCSALAVSARTTARTFAILIGAIAVFLTALPLAADYHLAWLRAVCAASPFGPLWDFVYDAPDGFRFSLPMSDLQRVFVAASWLAVAATAYLHATRPARAR